MGGGKEGGENNGKALFKKPSPGALYKDASEWLTSGSERSCHIRNSRARTIRGEKGGAEIEASTPYPFRVPRFTPLHALPKFQIPQNPLTVDQSVRRYPSRDPSLGSSPEFKSSLDKR